MKVLNWRIALIAFIASLILTCGNPLGVTAATKSTSASGTLQVFTTQSAAQAHCPKDEVVWLNTASGVYHEQGMRWYGKTKHGAYVCRKEVDSAGNRDTRNGQ